MHIRYIILAMMVSVGGTGFAAETEQNCTSTEPAAVVRQHAGIARKDTLVLEAERPEDLVIVRGDTVSMILPEKNYGRFDRGLYNYLYIPNHSWAFGVTASYGSLDTENLQLLSVLDNINFSGKLYSVKPAVSYFFRNNQAVGVRMNYTRGRAELKSLALDVADDLNFSLRDVSYDSHNYLMGLFYRNYVGLNRNKRFAVFNEVSLDFGVGDSHFKRYYSDVLYDTRTDKVAANLNFSPGLCVFIQEYVAFNVSFGVFGLHLTKEHQTTNGTDEGTRVSSGANFRFNIFNINFGLLVVI